MDRVDKLILLLPLWSLLDIASTFYTESQGYSLVLYEAGLLAGLFVRMGLTHVYLAAYLLIVAGIVCFFWVAKNRVLTPSYLLDRVLLGFLVCGLGYMYVVFVSTISGNLLLPVIVEHRINLSIVHTLGAAGAMLCLAFYVRHDVMLYLKAER